MKEFECYKCGYTKESDQKMELCPICGRTMCIIPYDKRKALIGEVIELLKIGEFYELKFDDFNEFYFLKSKTLFSSYDSIISHANKIKKIDNYIIFLNEIITNFEFHISNNLTERTDIDFKAIEKTIQHYDKIYSKLVNVVGLDFKCEEFAFPDIKAVLHLEKKKDHIVLVKEIIELLKQLVNKISRHIKTYSIFANCLGNNYSYILSKKDKAEDEYIKIKNSVTKILKKNPVFDFFDDGIDDLNIYLKIYWNAVYVLLFYALPEVQCYYELNGVKNHNLVNELISSRYNDIRAVYDSNDFLNSLDENEINEIADKLNNIVVSNNLFKGKGYKTITKTENKLEKLIGLKMVKESLAKIKAYLTVNKKSKDLNIHMCFLGNPGTGKTEVARIVAEILYENGILPSNKLVETDRAGLVGEYIGETPQKTMAVIRKAMGGVLFIDEAYSLIPEDGFKGDYGYEAVATLIKAMEDNRGKFCVILAGYKNQMKKMIASNPGFNSRIQFMLEFDNYNREEISQIATLMLEKRKYQLEDSAREKILDIIDVKRKEESFANAREVRNILDQVIMNQNLRAMNPKDHLLTLFDVNKYILDSKISLPTKGKDKTAKILTAEEELENLIGLTSVKKMIKKIKAFSKKYKDTEDFNIHMCFYGSPGTGKTVVARILSRILYEANILPESKLIETDRIGLVGSYVGETGPKTKKKIDDAMGGVLFIDEAYALVNKNEKDFGNEAIAVLLKEMEDKRGKFCTILAGYREEMQEMIASNPGFKSRIQFELEFPDYTREEFALIAKKIIEKSGNSITDEALELLLDLTDYYRSQSDFANARTLRNLIEQIILNQVLRTYEGENDFTIIVDDVQDYIDEKNIILKKVEPIAFDVDSQMLYLIKNEISMLPMQYSFFNRGMIDLNYVNEAVVSIAGNDGEGTGFIISPTGLCLTCEHCISNDNSQKARILFKTFDGKIMKVYNDFKVLFKDKENDVALIKINNNGLMFKFLPLENADYAYSPLSEFYVAGYPFGGESFEFISFSEGKIASVNYYNGRKVVFADMFGQPGSSGSPIINKNNAVIGIFFGGISKAPGEMIKCFTPIDVVWELIKKFNEK